MLSLQTDMPLSTDDFVIWLAERETAKADWRIGTEHEKFLYHLDDLRPVAYEGPNGIGVLLQALQAENNLTPIMEGDKHMV